MRRALPMLTTATLLVGACSGGSDETSDSTVASPETVAATTEASVPATEASTTLAETTTSEAPTTTIDEAALLAEAEAAYLQAFEVARSVFRGPEDPNNEAALRSYYTGENLERSLDALADSLEGGFVAVENTNNPSFATVIEPAVFVDSTLSAVELAVCEFNSDRIFERGTAPGGGDSLVRDDPVSLLFVVTMEIDEGTWKSSSGTRSDEVRDEVERCSEFS